MVSHVITVIINPCRVAFNLHPQQADEETGCRGPGLSPSLPLSGSIILREPLNDSADRFCDYCDPSAQVGIITTFLQGHVRNLTGFFSIGTFTPVRWKFTHYNTPQYYSLCSRISSKTFSDGTTIIWLGLHDRVVLAPVSPNDPVEIIQRILYDVFI